MPKKSPASGSRFQLSNSFVYVLILIQILLLSLGTFYTLVTIDILKRWENEKAQSISSFVRNQIDNEKSKATLPAIAAANNPDIVAAYAGLDRNRLLAVCQDLWRQLQTYGLKQFQFNILTPSGAQVFLRVHQPDQYGDLISASRPTVVKAIQDKALVFGLEQGKSGYGFRSVTPVFNHGVFIGTLEMGTDFGKSLLESLNVNYSGQWSIINLDLGVATSGVDRSLIASLNLAEAADPSKLKPTPEPILKAIRAGNIWVGSDRSTEMVSLYIPIQNFRGDIALFIKHSYVTDYYQKLRQVVWVSVLVCLAGLLISAFIINLLYRQITIPIKKLVVEADKIRGFELDDKVEINASLVELKDLVAAMANMKVGLQSFKKYVPGQLVRQLIASGQEAKISGQRRELTVLFSDIADFTSISEALTPSQLAAQLSEYLNEVTDIIMEESGTVDKYIGDSIMAFWGAPLELKNHAILACRAALRAQRTIDAMSVAWEREGKPVFRTRIGINTGGLIVGNIGSDQRLNYTVIGDVVNLASRLEALNKHYRTAIILSDSTFKLCTDEFEVRVLDYVIVKGKTEAVTIYELLADKGDISTKDFEFVGLYEEGIAAYRKREWDQAIRKFSKALECKPSDTPAGLFLKRCEEYRGQTLPDDWSGEYIFHEK